MTELIDLNELGIDPTTEPLEVAESRLYKGIDKDKRPIAVKIYKGLSLDQIVLYRDITNKLASLHNGENIEIEFGGKNYNLSLYIVPIEKVGLSGNLPVTISPFIEGETLFKAEPHYISSRFTNLRAESLTKLGDKFRDEMQVDNISIIPWNVKPLLNETPQRLAITDITGAIRDLRRR